jgi:hypothetical protein
MTEPIYGRTRVTPAQAPNCISTQAPPVASTPEATRWIKSKYTTRCGICDGRILIGVACTWRPGARPACGRCSLLLAAIDGAEITPAAVEAEPPSADELAYELALMTGEVA